MKNIQILVRKALDLVSEVETYTFYRRNLEISLDNLFNAYQSGRFTYFQYEKEQDKLLKGRTKEEWIEYYDSYIVSLLKRIEAYNSQIFYETYQDENYKYIGEKKPKRDLVPVHTEVPAPLPPRGIAVKPKEEHEIFVQKKKELETVPVAKAEKTVEPQVSAPIKRSDEKRTPAKIVLPEKTVEERIDEVKAPAAKGPIEIVNVKPSIIDNIAIFFRRVFRKKEVKEQLREIKTEKPLKAPKVEKVIKKKEKMQKKLEKATFKDIKSKDLKKLSWFDRLFTPKQKGLEFKPPEEFPDEAKLKADKEAASKKTAAEKASAQHKKTDVSMGGGIFDSIRAAFARSQKSKVEFSAKQGKVELSTLHLETSRRKIAPEIKTQIEKITATALTKEAKRIKSIMGKKKALKIYQPSFFGSLANLSIKRISLFLLDAFPDFFKDLYHSLRLANIKVLSNTYVNMMVLGVIASFFAGLFFLGLFFAATQLPFIQIISRTLMMSLLLSLVTFAGFYSYPSSMVKKRRRSINSNLPFAINHMSAVASSGVSPTKMFKLISQSKEYGEISGEIEKVVNYIDIFGYDILTAIKAIAATTPSYAFKDFLEGMISTTQTGGDMKTYLSQKAEEAMLNYKLERQKYSETIATYSDIYTGILIAAPLFFVAALSLVSLLGGTVGGMDVNVIIVMGTYVVIPIMNVSFLTFLEITQPEI